MEFLSGFSSPIIVGICLSVGYIIKNVLPGEGINKFIPLVMGVLGIGVGAWINLSFTPEILLEGLVSGLASTGLYETFHQFIKK